MFCLSSIVACATKRQASVSQYGRLVLKQFKRLIYGSQLDNYIHKL